ncbi:MAG: carboxypeptidase regulatory-like domain-containing protein [Verrucomicrobia bacterium]|nr:carboxypeptidase regulatory-like domain-containing protein [Verrucomicrobiota bacterium]
MTHRTPLLGALLIVGLALQVLLIATAAAFTDLEVTYIERNPKYKSYQGRVLYSGKTFTDDYTPYWATYAYAISGQTPATKRWPDNGETVTFTAHIYNRGDTDVPSFTYEWRLDDALIGSGTYSTATPAGGFVTLSKTWSWAFALHRIRFEITGPGDDKASNDFIEDFTNALTMLTFVDCGFADEFEASTPSWPLAQTDSIMEWLQRHRQRLNDMFEAAGSQCRVRYDRLEYTTDGAGTPSYDTTDYDSLWPTRLYQGQGDPRSPGYYSAEDDIDYGYLHETGHQLGIIDLYRLDVSPEQNLVNGQGYSAMPGLMHGCSNFISEHTALAMDQWHGKRRGYFGQYLFWLPATNKLKLLDANGLPLDGATVTVYQKLEISGVGERIPNIPKFTGTTDANGIFVFPNVSLGEKSLFWADTGDVLNDNPFGYIWCVGPNGVFLIKVQKGGAVDYVWVDITDFNIAYWHGNTTEATYVRDTALGGGGQYAPPAELTELNAANWAAWAQGGWAETSDDTTKIKAGTASIKFDTNGAFDTYMKYPAGLVAHWDLRSVTSLNVWFYAVNTNPPGFQNYSPTIRLGNFSGDYIQLQPSYDILNDCRNMWRFYSIPLAGNSTWTRTDHGTPNLKDINYIEIHMDTWDAGFQVWADGMLFSPQPVPVDEDADGLPDYWELDYFEDFDEVGSGNPDNDGLTNAEEYANRTDPTKADTDNDGLQDDEELALGFDPTDPRSGFRLLSVEWSQVVPSWIEITWTAHEMAPITIGWTGDTPSGSQTWNLVDGDALSDIVYNGDGTWTWTDKGTDPDMGGLPPGSLTARLYRLSQE